MLAGLVALVFALALAFGLQAWLSPDFALADNPGALATEDEEGSDGDDSQDSDDSGDSGDSDSSDSSDTSDDSSTSSSSSSKKSSSSSSKKKNSSDDEEVGGLMLRVIDADMADSDRIDDDGLTDPQGDATFAGMKFNVYKPNGKLVKTLTVGANGEAILDEDDYLPLGTYTIKQVADTARELGYKENKGWSTKGQEVEILEPYEIVDAGTCICEVIRGGLRLNMVDSDLYDVLGVEDVGQGGASLADAVFEVYNGSQEPVLMGDTLYDPYEEWSDYNEPIMELTTDEWGVVTTDNDTGVFDDETGLPWGTYVIKQKETSQGYRAMGDDDEGDGEGEEWRATVEVKGEERFNMDEPIRATVIRGGVKIQAVDAETADGSAQGDAKLKGIVFEIVNDNGDAEGNVEGSTDGAIVMDGKAYAPGDVVMKVKAVKGGVAKSAASVLPYGTYKVRMAKKGNSTYAYDKDWEASITVKKNKKRAGLGKGKAFEAKVVRGGLTVKQLDSETRMPVEGATIEVVNASKHSVVVKGSTYDEGKVVLTLSPDEEGVADTAANVLPYGTYILRESQAASGYDLNKDWNQRVKVRKAGAVVDAGTVYETVSPVLAEEAAGTTSRANTILPFVGVAILAAAVAAIAIFRARRKKEQSLMQAALPKASAAAAAGSGAARAAAGARAASGKAGAAAASGKASATAAGATAAGKKAGAAAISGKASTRAADGRKAGAHAAGAHAAGKATKGKAAAGKVAAGKAASAAGGAAVGAAAVVAAGKASAGAEGAANDKAASAATTSAMAGATAAASGKTAAKSSKTRTTSGKGRHAQSAHASKSGQTTQAAKTTSLADGAQATRALKTEKATQPTQAADATQALSDGKATKSADAQPTKAISGAKASSAAADQATQAMQPGKATNAAASKATQAMPSGKASKAESAQATAANKVREDAKTVQDISSSKASASAQPTRTARAAQSARSIDVEPIAPQEYGTVLPAVMTKSERKRALKARRSSGRK